MLLTVLIFVVAAYKVLFVDRRCTFGGVGCCLAFVMDGCLLLFDVCCLVLFSVVAVRGCCWCWCCSLQSFVVVVGCWLLAVVVVFWCLVLLRCVLLCVVTVVLPRFAAFSLVFVVGGDGVAVFFFAAIVWLCVSFDMCRCWLVVFVVVVGVLPLVVVACWCYVL